MKEPDWQQVASLAELDSTGGRGFCFARGGASYAGLILRWRGKVYAYINSCPHTGVELNWQPDQFFDIDKRYLQCSMHGALFEPDTGRCIHGPCLGRSLHSIPVELRGEDIYVDCTALSESTF